MIEDLWISSSGGPAFAFVFEDHVFEQGLDDPFFLGREIPFTDIYSIQALQAGGQ